MAQPEQLRGVKELTGKIKRLVGYASTFGLIGFFLIPVIPATAAIGVGMVVGAVVAKKMSKK